MTTVLKPTVPSYHRAQGASAFCPSVQQQSNPSRQLFPWLKPLTVHPYSYKTASRSTCSPATAGLCFSRPPQSPAPLSCNPCAFSSRPFRWQDLDGTWHARKWQRAFRVGKLPRRDRIERYVRRTHFLVRARIHRHTSSWSRWRRSQMSGRLGPMGTLARDLHFHLHTLRNDISKEVTREAVGIYSHGQR